MTTKLLDLPELIEWHEGMLLTPQHFQQMAERGERLPYFLSVQTAPYAWGVIQLKIDEAALGGGMLRILNVEAVMPDGLLVAGGSDYGMSLELDLQKLEENPARIFLTVPREAAVYQRGEYSRYEAILDRADVAEDEVSSASPAVIPRIRPRLRLSATRADLGGLTAMPILEFSADGTVLTRTDYVAPLLRVRAGSPVAALCGRVRKALREMATNLAGRLRPGSTNSDSLTVHQLQWLVAALPPFESLLESDLAHPYAFYLALTSIAGSVAFLSHARVPPIFPAYDHDDLLRSFQEVAQFIRLALSEGLVENWNGRSFALVSVEGERRDAAYELGPTLEQAFGADTDFSSNYFGMVVVLPPGVAPDTMTEWGESCLLASEDAIADLELSRSQGARCERVDFLEDLIAAPGSLLFRVKNDTHWIDPRRKLVLKPARQERRNPESVTLFLKRRSAH
ncbi:type VI secretion system baseplate subunit TssK [Silvibacterium sp.]|uniref:type VI secretion system baseplate subunit TssK n=1 Tax=Silvibacterium sp. TaxID=1964179 RepID=UPI0039E313EE